MIKIRQNTNRKAGHPYEGLPAPPKKIAAVVIGHIYGMRKEGEPFDGAKYEKEWKALRQGACLLSYYLKESGGF